MIDFKDIEVKFDDFVALRDINIHVNEGEFFTLLGPSGCGKTTTLRTLVGFIKPSKGTITVNGKDITHQPIEERNIAMVFQSYALFPTLNVYENIAFGLKVKKINKNEIKERVFAIADKVELTYDQLVKKVSDLSGGQQQRVAIARALILEPAILCLDEPLSNLDAKLRIQLRIQLKELQHKVGITTIYVTHDQEEALTLSDHIAVFNKGYLEQIGTPEEIYNQSKTEFVCNFIGDINFLNPQVVEEINQQTGSLLDVNKKSYIRTEKVIVSNAQTNQGFAEFDAVVEDMEFFGLYSKYKLGLKDSQITAVEMGGDVTKEKIGDSVHLIIDPADIMQY